MVSKAWLLALVLACCAVAAVESSDISSQTSGRKLLQQQGGRSSSVQPRLDVAEIDGMEEDNSYRIMMLLAWQQLTTSSRRTSPLSYWQVAGVHGKNWAYNGVSAPDAGFCRHAVPEFAPWHRAYMRQFELALIQAAREAAAKFQSESLRTQYQSVAELIRLPYWDWTSSSVPSLLTASTVTVLDYATGAPTTIRNPFGSYQYTAVAGDGHAAGRASVRASTWAQTINRSARRFGNEMALFLRSNNWRCTYVSTATCVGNLESTHNEIHNVIGGTGGELTTFTYAGFDPLFWLLHSMVDRVLYLFQNNGGQWVTTRSYSPFSLAGDASDTTSYGYTYSAGRAIRCNSDCEDMINKKQNENSDSDDEDDSSKRRRNRNRNRNSGSDSSSKKNHGTGHGGGSRRNPPSNTNNRKSRRSGNGAELASVRAEATLAEIPTLTGREAVLAAIEQWTGNYTGFSWSVRFQELDQHQLNEPVHLLVFLKSSGPSAQAIPAQVEDLNQLRLRPNYCGSIAGFNEQPHTHLPSVAGQGTVSRTIDLTSCLEDAGIDPDVPAVNPADYSRGPAQIPVRLSNLQIVALTASGQDVSDRFNVGKTVISWSVPVTRSAAEIRAAAAADPIEAQAVTNPLAFAAGEDVLAVAMGDVAL